MIASRPLSAAKLAQLRVVFSSVWITNLQMDVVHELWSVEEHYEGNTSTVDIDLSSLAGQDVNFVLTVLSLGPASDNRALWVEPRIVRERHSCHRLL